MALTANPFRKSAPTPLVAQLAATQTALEDTADDEAIHATYLAELAAEAKQQSVIAAEQSVAVAQAISILTSAGVTV